MLHARPLLFGASTLLLGSTAHAAPDAAGAAPPTTSLAPASQPIGTRNQPEKQRALLLRATLQNGVRRLPGPDEHDAQTLLHELDELLIETSRDLGLALESSPPQSLDPTTVTDLEMLEMAKKTAHSLIAAAITLDGATVELRIALAAPEHRAVLARTERFARDNLSVRAVVMLRDIVTDAKMVAKTSLPTPPAQNPGTPLVTVRSEGRTVLAANATVFGGMMGFSVERAGGSNDPRLLYPLVAVGAGVGLGASLLIAGEWDVGLGDAWFLSSGGLWPTASAHLLFEGRFGDASGHPSPESDRWAFGLVGGSLGLTLSTLSLALGDMNVGGAVLAHSGGAFGLAFGGLTEWFVRGDTNAAPFAGMGYGAAIGWLATASAASSRVHLPPVRILTVDLGIVLGGLAGAALSSPLVFDEPSADEVRGWVGAIGGGAILGAGVALFLTRGDSTPTPKPPPVLRIARGLTIHPQLPEIGLIGETALFAATSRAGQTSPSQACGANTSPANGCDVASASPAFGVRLRGLW